MWCINKKIIFKKYNCPVVVSGTSVGHCICALTCGWYRTPMKSMATLMLRGVGPMMMMLLMMVTIRFTGSIRWFVCLLVFIACFLHTQTISLLDCVTALCTCLTMRINLVFSPIYACVGVRVAVCLQRTAHGGGALKGRADRQACGMTRYKQLRWWYRAMPSNTAVPPNT